MNKDNLMKSVGQMLVVGFNGKEINSDIKELIHQYKVGSFILFGRNIGTPSEVLSLTTALQSEAKKAGYEHPLLICVDQENGVVRRLNEGTTIFPGAMTLGATDNSENAYNVGLASGRELKDLGINWNLAPVLDVNNNPDNPVIGVRSFGESAESVADFGLESMKGMQQAGIVTTLKHFPGHGDTNIDSHVDLPTIHHDLKRLNEIELKPFKECIEFGADTVMTAHIYFPAIETKEGLPATLSKNVLTGLLRERLKFDGVITTDCMEMNAISQTVGTEKGAVEAIRAGADYIMISHTFESQVGAIKEIIKAVELGELDIQLIEESNRRIRQLKQKYLNWDDIDFENIGEVPETVGSHEHKELAKEVYRESTTIVKNNGVLPLNTDKKLFVIHPDNGTTMQVEDKSYAKLSLGEAVRHYQPSADVEEINSDLTASAISSIVEKAKQYDSVIVGTLTISAKSSQVTLIEKLIENGANIIVIAMRSPYDLAYLPDVPVYINTYEFTYPALEVAAGAIFGKEIVSGKLPVTI